MAAPPTANIGDHAPPDQAFTQGGECALKLGPVEEDTADLGHAASRSAADR